MRNIAVFSGHRAEAGHIGPVARAIKQHADMSCTVIATEDNQALYELPKVDLTVSIPRANRLPDMPSVMSASIAAVGSALAESRPDCLVVYGDRSETFCAATAAYSMGIPVAHIEGGDVTQGGCLDDGLRGAITEFASLHFATNAQSAARLREREEAWRVFEAGLPILDGSVDPIPRPDVPLILFCQHPVHLDQFKQIRPSLSALAEAHERLGANVIAIMPNGDAGSGEIAEEIRCYAKHMHVALFHVPRSTFHGMMSVASCIVGNSSAGIKEAPAFNCPAVNVGDRQLGRLRGDNVIDVPHDDVAIYRAIETAVEWRRSGRVFTSPYGGPGASARIASVLAGVSLDRRMLVKRRS